MARTKRNTDLWGTIHRRRSPDVTRLGEDCEAQAGVSLNTGSDVASAEVTVMERAPGVYIFAAWRRLPGKLLEKVAEWTVEVPHRAAAEVTP